MEEIVWSCSDYSIIKVGTDRLHVIARFVVAQNYSHHSYGSIPQTSNQEIEDIFHEELAYSGTSMYFIVVNAVGKMIGCRKFSTSPRWKK